MSKEKSRIDYAKRLCQHIKKIDKKNTITVQDCMDFINQEVGKVSLHLDLNQEINIEKAKEYYSQYLTDIKDHPSPLTGFYSFEGLVDWVERDQEGNITLQEKRRYLVLVKTDVPLTEKHINRLAHIIHSNKDGGGLIITSEMSIAQKLYRYAEEAGVQLRDREDFLKEYAQMKAFDLKRVFSIYRFKYLAKEAKRLSISHSQALEALSQAFYGKTWHIISKEMKEPQGLILSQLSGSIQKDPLLDIMNYLEMVLSTNIEDIDAYSVYDYDEILSLVKSSLEKNRRVFSWEAFNSVCKDLIDEKQPKGRKLIEKIEQIASEVK